MAAVRILLIALLLTVALTPLVLHFSVWGPELLREGHVRVAVASIIGAVSWAWLCMRALPAPKVTRS